VTATVSVVRNALYVPDLATDILTLHVPAVAGATRRPVLMRHLPDVTVYVRVPFETVFTMRDNRLRLPTFTERSAWVTPAVTVTFSAEPLTTPEAFFTEMENV
jgi:hypothetical protein